MPEFLSDACQHASPGGRFAECGRPAVGFVLYKRGKRQGWTPASYCAEHREGLTADLEVTGATVDVPEGALF